MMDVLKTGLVALIIGVSAQSAAAAAKTYQVTGPVLDVDATTITVEKGKEKWQIARDATTQGPGEIKVGEKVTITYRMMATSIESKATSAKK